MAVRRSIDDRVAPEQTLRQTIAMATRASSGGSARPFSEHPLLLLGLWVVGTALSWPVPYQELDSRAKPLYNSTLAAGASTYGLGRGSGF